MTVTDTPGCRTFQSTPSLRRATIPYIQEVKTKAVSIHALLAESDPRHFLYKRIKSVSIHALLAESDRRNP